MAGDVAFQAAHDFTGVEALGAAASDITAGLVVGGHPGDHDLIQRRVGVAVAATVDAMPDGLAR